jgi:hypothetical protein
MTLERLLAKRIGHRALARGAPLGARPHPWSRF